MRPRARTLSTIPVTFICLCALTGAYTPTQNFLGKKGNRDAGYGYTYRYRPLRASAPPSAKLGLAPPFIFTTLRSVKEGDVWVTSLINEALGNQALLLKDIKVTHTRDGTGEVQQITGTQTNEDFLEDLPNETQVVFFVHGYNNPANHVIDVWKNLSKNLCNPSNPSDVLVVPLLWPARGRLNYWSQQQSAARTAEFVAKVVNRDPKQPVNLVLHSMGNYILQKLCDQEIKVTKPFRNVFMAAADVDFDIFSLNASEVEIAEFPASVGVIGLINDGISYLSDVIYGKPRLGSGAKISELSDTVHVMWSIKDVALFLSRFINRKPRLGRTGLGDLYPNNCKNQDCADFHFEDRWGHSYFTGPEAVHLYRRAMNISL